MSTSVHARAWPSLQARFTALSAWAGLLPFPLNHWPLNSFTGSMRRHWRTRRTHASWRPASQARSSRLSKRSQIAPPGRRRAKKSASSSTSWQPAAS